MVTDMTDMTPINAASRGRPYLDASGLEALLAAHRAELAGYCYRMLGSAFDAEDAVQDTFVRAWRSIGSFEGRSTFRAWLYRIATNVCLTMLSGRAKRALPTDLGSPHQVGTKLDPALTHDRWVQPVPDSRVLNPDSDPAEIATSRETIRIAFVAALQHLPPRQRAVLILRDVLRWPTADVADLLDTTAVSVKSALQRARATLQTRPVPTTPTTLSTAQEDLLARYVEAFERYDITALVDLLVEDATLSMPPLPVWLRGKASIGQWWGTEGTACANSRLVPVEANAAPAFAQYHKSSTGTGYDAFALQIIALGDHLIEAFDIFVDPETFALFGLPQHIEP